MESLREKGYAIIPGVLSESELDYAGHLFWHWIGNMDCQFPGIEDIHATIDPHGIFKHHEAGHTAHSWFIRTRKGVQKPFQDLYGTKDLIVSFDGCCWMTKEKYKNKRDNTWTHTDQAACYPDFKCVQGFVSLTDNKHSSLVVYEGSHKLHKEYFESRGDTSKDNWNKIDPDYLEEIKDRKRVLEVKAGDLVLWDSRTFHQNQYGNPHCEDRIVQYVCFLPKNHQDNTKVNSKKRQTYFQERRTTSHWPCPVRVNGLQPRTYGREELKIDYSLCIEPDYEDWGEEIAKLV